MKYKTNLREVEKNIKKAKFVLKKEENDKDIIICVVDKPSSKKSLNKQNLYRK